MARVVVYGTGQVASVVHTYLTEDSPHEVVAFTVGASHVASDTFLDLSVVPFEDVARHYPPTEFAMIIAIGFQQVNRLRAEKYAEAKASGYELITYIHSKATVWKDLVIGDNCVVMEDTVIQPFAVVGNDVILGPGSCVGHHSIIKDHCLLASHVDVSGNVIVEPYCFLGANSTIRDGVTVAEECVVGANVAIHQDTISRGVYVGPRPELLGLPSNKLPRI
jgi:sugar O-acyltransferase (sialic acid O-acetyltransferase NeuD family)